MKTTFLANFIAAIFIVAALTLSLPSSAMADSTLTLSEAYPPLRADNYRLTAYDGAHNVPLLNFRTKCEGQDTIVSAVTVLVHGSTPHSHPSTVYLYDGTTLISSAAMPVDEWLVHFMGIDIPNAANTAKVLTVKADFPANDISPSVVWAEVSSVVYQKTLGSTSILFPPKIIRGPTQHLMKIAANWTLATTPTVTSNQNQNGTTTNATASFTFNVTAMGGAIQEPGSTVKEITVVATTTNGLDKVICPTISIVTIPHNNIADGSTASVTVTANLPASAVKRSGLYYFYVQQINWQSVDGSAKIQQFWGLEDFKTPAPVNYQLASTNTNINFHLPLISYNLWDDVSAVLIGGEWGYPGQVVSEGGFIRLSPENLNPTAYIIFPMNTPNGGRFMQIDVAMTASTMVPSMFTPAYSNAKGDTYPVLSYPVTNIQTTQYGSGGAAETVTFTIQIAETGFLAYGTIYRTCESSCLVRLFWGSGATYDSLGEGIDMLDMSPSMDPPSIPDKGLIKHPPRFKFGIQGVAGNSSVFNMTVDTMPGAFTLQGTSDMVNWVSVPYYTFESITDNGDGSQLASISIKVGELPAQLNPNRSFFRMATNP